LQRRGGIARHDAVAWGYARAADARGVDIIQNCEVTGIEQNARGLRSADASANAAFRIHLRKLLVGLVKRGGFEIFHDLFICLAPGWKAGQKYDGETKQCNWMVNQKVSA
jgi:hypothetical protein